jgi:hypothetical protein
MCSCMMSHTIGSFYIRRRGRLLMHDVSDEMVLFTYAEVADFVHMHDVS